MSKKKEVTEQALVGSLLPRYLRLKESLSESEKRYGALVQICEALVRRCRATESLAEALVVEARNGRKESEKEKKKSKACESINAELLHRYHKDSAQFYAEGFAAGSPTGAKFKRTLKESANAMQAAHIAEGLVENVRKEVKTKKKQLCETRTQELRESHPSRLPQPSNLKQLEEAAKASTFKGEPNLVSAHVQWETRRGE
jgi:hypothetical protein